MVTIRQRLLFGISAAVVWSVIILILSLKEIWRWLEYEYYSAPEPNIILWIIGISVFLWTTSFRVDIHVEKRYIKHYLWVFGLKLGIKKPLGEIEKIFINRQLMKDRVDDYYYIFRNEYWAFLKLTDGEKIKIKSQKDKGSLIKNLKQYNRILKTVIIDTTTDPPEVVDS
jgi:hypothetical protein